MNEDGPSPPSGSVSARAGPRYAGICGRSPAVRDALLEKLTRFDNCALVEARHLHDLTGRLVIRASDYTYKYGDFFDLRQLTALEVSGTSLSVITWEMLEHLESLTTLDLSDNGICKIDAGALNHPTALEVLLLNGNHLGDTSACPGIDGPGLQGHVFNRLTALQLLNLHDNRLSAQSFDYRGHTYSELPTFQKLTALREIRLGGNGLGDPHLQRSFDTGGNPGPVSIFTGLTGLQLIDLSNNQLDQPAGRNLFRLLKPARAVSASEYGRSHDYDRFPGNL